ncbi:DNA mismatch repair endonuclease MutL [Aliidiomarina maris]|uniref:DNA mismatch repair protein MutL n=1 Tax=Aliidiomarina maris TaxID=531312 RepID=A0A327X236_9GAMM|nr:DNA mismatch repair endonuclease MutL [Aliidiomarina maris]RAJ99194.1 DNA mismatch repair protein MutL [Aliidiomarina maris]RUO27660.1 DNA mismatch repair protein MutL [Aliidiomarina maris]
MPIRQLPLQLANQIAAGEVVERPSSVVKELVENSIDAGATDLSLDIEQGGAKRIRLRDNGSGIAKDELALALSRHATSKIHTLDDLESIQSLGFRGEALASISSVSRLTLTSKPADQSEAWQAFCEGRDMQVQIQPAAHPQGTTVDVQDLFFNTPARRKFLRTEKTEFGHIDEVVRRIALAAPHVRIHLTHNGRKVRDYKPMRGQAAEQIDVDQALPRLKAIAGQGFAQDAVFLQHTFEQWQLHGWIAPAQACRHQGDVQYMYVNGRMMKDKLLNHAIRQAYDDSLNDDRQPTYVLYLTLPAREVDVNVHPAKHEVRFHQARQIHDFVLHSLRQAIASYKPLQDDAPSFTTTESNLNPQGPVTAANEAPAQQAYQPPPRHAYQQPHSDSAAAHSAIRQLVEQDAPAAAAYYQQLMTPAAQTSAPALTPGHSQWRRVGLLAQRYALMLQHSTQMTSDLALIDVSAVQVAVEQARLKQKLKQGLSGQPLLLPVQLELAEPLQPEQQQQLAVLGVQLKMLSTQRAVVMQVPTMLRQRDISQLLPKLIELLDATDLTEHQALHRWLAQQAELTQFSESQADYWLQESANLDIQANFLRALDWQSTLN